ncbi:MAG: FAD-binding oxidoreductase [Thermodesulfobacteriota bacterium]
MKQELLEQLDGYDSVRQEIAISRKFGDDFSLKKGQVAKIVNRLHPDKIKLCVTRTINETVSTKTIRLSAVNGYLPPFQAGQYISLSVEVDKVRTGRAYSISSSPSQTGYYDITVRRVENGRVSNFLIDEVKVGDLLESSGPEGHFHYNPILHQDELVCLAGGSGITPFMSMIREITDKGLKRKLNLFYGSQYLHDMIFHEELSQLAKQFSNINYIPVVENPSADYKGKTGFITARVIKESLGEIKGKSYFICGPQGMYKFCLPELDKLGIKREQIRQEMFGTPVNVTEQMGWPSNINAEDRFTVQVNRSEPFETNAGTSLLTALEESGFIIPFLCRSGECSRCRIKIVEGKVFQPTGTPVRKSDSHYGYVHSCVSYPLDNLKILI